MSTLFLIRHAQASIHRDDYDALSETGIEQARRLGAFVADRKLAFDAMYVGSMKRHLETALHLRQAAEAAGWHVPEPVPLAGFDELEVQVLLGEAMARVLPSCPDFPAQLASGRLDERGRLAKKHMLGMVAKLVERWTNGEELAGLEPFAAFEARVHGALRDVMRTEGRGKTVAVVSSGGPITAAVRLALGAPREKMAAIMFELENGSLSELRYTEHRLTLRRLNVTGYLPDELVTRI